MDKNLHLDNVLKSHSVNLDEGAILENYKKKRDAVKEALEKKFGNEIVKIINSGSYAKNTAINTKFDMDLCIHFKKRCYKTLKEMYDAIFEFLNEEFKNGDKDLVKVRPQKVSVGLKFNVEGEDLLFDVTPGRKTSEDSSDNNINLYINDDEIEANWTKTNIQDQIEYIKGKNNERECIRLLKVWKFKHKVDVKSFLVELATIKAFEATEVNNEIGKWNRLKTVIEYISENIESLSLIDPGNSNNNVANSLTKEEKTALKDSLKIILEKVENDDTKLKYYFPENPKYPQNDVYEHSGATSASILSTQTFG